jgi:ATP-dependent DNA ligase
MLVHNTGRELVAYTRNGKIIDTLDHILRHIDIPRGYTLDGEVYYHGVPLQTVASWCKRVQPETLKLEYVVYDTILPTEYGRRYEELRDFNLRGPIRLAETWKTDRPIPEDLHDSIEKGYEGLILRSGRLPYGAGKRCKSLIKVKKAYDDEFLVVDVEESRDGWGVLVCKTLFNKEFRVSAPGTIPEKTAILMNKHQYIGMWVTVEYFSLTKDGIPFHPVAINFRDNYSE